MFSQPFRFIQARYVLFALAVAMMFPAASKGQLPAGLICLSEPTIATLV